MNAQIATKYVSWNFIAWAWCLTIWPFSFTEEPAKMLAASVSVDKTNYSVSFNEFLKLFSIQRDGEPDHETLVDVFA